MKGLIRSYGLVLMLNLVANITLFILAIIYYSKDLPEVRKLEQTPSAHTLRVGSWESISHVMEVAIQAVITRHGPCNRWK
eukprot:1354721-Amorphochlora_amoeboformis.AAC.1